MNFVKASLHLSVILTLFFMSSGSIASDHIDGPITSKHKVTDLTDLYAFPSPENEGSLSLILNTYFAASSSNHFNENVLYKFHIRKVKSGASLARFTVGDEVTIVCEFKTPHDHSKHKVSCITSNGLSITGNTDTELSSSSMRLFTGLRSDSFFFSALWSKSVSGDGKLVPPDHSNSMDRLNCLSIALEVDMNQLFPGDKPAMYSVAASTSTVDVSTSHEKQLDWIGRPEITNVTLVPKKNIDLRDSYNKEKPYALSSDGRKKYHKHLVSNIGYYDALDGKLDWNDYGKNLWANILLDDFLVVDLTKPCLSDNYLSIEKALLEGEEHTSCGGRVVSDDIMDTLYTLYINADEGPKIGDGVDAPFKAASDKFPYLAEPETGARAFFARQKSKFFAWLASKL